MNHVVIVGGGTAGAVLAARLSEDPLREVTLIEAGSAHDTPAELLDGASLPAVVPGHAANWGYQAWLQPTTSATVPRGRILGGSSAINGGYFIRPRPQDFERWASVSGPQWSFERALPLLTRLENDLDFGNQSIHGTSGPIRVRRPPQSGRLATLFTQAALELGFAEEADKNQSTGPVGVGAVPSNIIDGVRINAAMAYLADARSRPNLTIMGDTRALRVRVSRGRAVGVETDRGVVDADEVVLAAGSVATPHLLMLSGIGPTDQLTAHGIATVSDLPVGQSFSDHPNLSVSWHSSLPLVNPAELFAFPTALNFDSSGSAGHYPDGDLEILLSVKPLSLLLHPDVASQPADGTDEHHVMVSLQSPRGRGHMTLASDDPLVQPRIDYNYLADEVDAERMRVGVRTAARLLQSAAFEGTFASFSSLSGEILADDELLDEWITTHLSTAIHLSGSAPMGEVVDGHGRVYGVDALRVADTSILPAVPSRGTFNAAVFIGEFIAHQMAQARSR
jgi:predicted dehydrogenase (TIGR03970 family)